jgi:RNA polymerase sigma-70 factor (ECF subfamily)
MTRNLTPFSLSKRARKTGAATEAAMHGGEIEQLYRKHARALTAHCTNLLGNTNQARDAVHEAFERVMRAGALELFEDARAVPYLYRTSTNICLDMLRHQGVLRRVEPHMTARAQDSEAVDPAHERRDYARALLAGVAARTAAVGVMHFVEGMNQQEIASELGMSRRSIFNHLKKLEQRAAELDDEASQTANQRR